MQRVRRPQDAEGVSFVVRRATLEEILALRHAVLRPGLPREAARFAGDEAADTIHVGAFLPSGEVVGCASVMATVLEQRPSWRLRGMATCAELRRCGIGRRVLALAEAAVCAGPQAPLLWCEARVEAVGFYRRCGWAIVSGVFEVAGVGPHHRMIKRW